MHANLTCKDTQTHTRLHMHTHVRTLTFMTYTHVYILYIVEDTTAVPTTTVAAVECKQLYNEGTCQTLLQLPEYTCSHELIVSKCCNFSCVTGEYKQLLVDKKY